MPCPRRDSPQQAPGCMRRQGPASALLRSRSFDLALAFDLDVAGVADDEHHHAAILTTAFSCCIARDRLTLAVALGDELLRIDAAAHEVTAYRIGAPL